MTEQAKPAGTATLTYRDKTVELPVLSGSTGPDVSPLVGTLTAFFVE